MTQIQPGGAWEALVYPTSPPPGYSLGTMTVAFDTAYVAGSTGSALSPTVSVWSDAYGGFYKIARIPTTSYGGALTGVPTRHTMTNVPYKAAQSTRIRFENTIGSVAIDVTNVRVTGWSATGSVAPYTPSPLGTRTERRPPFTLTHGGTLTLSNYEADVSLFPQGYESGVAYTSSRVFFPNGVRTATYTPAVDLPDFTWVMKGWVAAAIIPWVTGSCVEPDGRARTWESGAAVWMTVTVFASNATFTVDGPDPIPTPRTIPIGVEFLPDDDRDAVSGPHRGGGVAYVETWDAAVRVPLPIIGGSVTLDRTATTRGTCRLVVAPCDLMPPSGTSPTNTRPLHPYGSHVIIGRSVNDTLICLGTFRIDNVSRDRATDQLTVTGTTFESWLADARFQQARTFGAPGAPSLPGQAAVVARDLIIEAGCGWRVLTSSTALPVNYALERTGDRREAVAGLADLLGAEVFADLDGAIVVAVAVDPATAPVRHDLTEGAGCVVTADVDVLDRRDLFDVSVAYNADLPDQAWAWATDQGSPIARLFAGPPPGPGVYGGGAFAQGGVGKPFFYASPSLSSATSRRSAAATVHTRRAMPAARIAVECVPVPDLRPADIVTLTRDSGVQERWQVEVVDTPLDVESPQRLTLVGTTLPLTVTTKDSTGT